MHRFFVDTEWLTADQVELTGATARQLAKVLRARTGDRIELLDGEGWSYVVELTSVTSARVEGNVAEKRAASGEPRVAVTLYQALLKHDKFEFVLQKGTELGVSGFVPVVCERSVTRAGEARRVENRLDRWRRIVTEAAEQSGRARLPKVGPPLEFRAACELASGFTIIPWELERRSGLKTVLGEEKESGRALASVAVFIGPEGGFTDEEVAYAHSHGARAVSLGERVLRAETAGIATVAAIMYELGELGA